MAEAAASSRSPKWKLTVVIVLIAGAVGYCTYEPGPIPFERDAWRNAEHWRSSENDSPRLRMADGLVRDRVLIGKSRAEVEAMLGPRADTSKFREYDLVYWLGRERGFMGIDSEWLVARVDAKGIVVEAQVVHD